MLWRAVGRQLHRKTLAIEAGTSQRVIKDLLDEGDIHLLDDKKTVQLSWDDSGVQDRIIELRGGELYLDILHFLAEKEGFAEVSEIYEHTDAKLAHLRELQEGELITLGESEVWRDSLSDRQYLPEKPPILTDAQADAWARGSSTY